MTGTVLRIGYVFGRFPVPTQTFAVSDLDALARHPAHVEALVLSPGRSDAARAAGWSGPVDYPRHWLSGLTALRGVRDWRRLIHGLRLILPAMFTHPAEALIALACLGRAVQICRVADRGGYDVLHAFWSRHPLLPLILLDRVPGPNPPLRTAFLGAYDLVHKGFLLHKGLGAAEVVFTHALENLDALTALVAPGTPVVMVHRGIPLALDQEAPPPPRRPGAMVTASSLTKDKNVSGVVRAFAGHLERHPQARLDVIGDGPERSSIQALCDALGVAHAVTLHGHVPRPEVFRRMQSAEVFLFLSRKASERLPNVLKEAMYAGCAVVSSPSVGLGELMSDPQAGWIVDPDDPADIQRALEDAVSESEPLRIARRAVNRRRIQDGFSSGAAMEAYVQAWTRALNISSRR